MDDRQEPRDCDRSSLLEQLSALMDGELPGSERAFLLRRLGHDRELAAAWSRYHQIREVLNRRQPDHDSARFAASVMERLNGESIPAPRRALGPWPSRLLFLATAASVAAAALLLSPTRAPTAAPPVATSPAGTAAMTASPPSLVPVLASPQRAAFGQVLSEPTRPVGVDAQYLLQHARFGGHAPGAASAYVEWVEQAR